MQTPRVLLIRPLRERELAIKTFLQLGVEIVIADEIHSGLVGFADRFLPVPSIPEVARRGKLELFEAQVAEFHRRYRLTGIVTTLDYLLPTVGRLNERLGLRGLSEDAGWCCFDKTRQRRRFNEHGVPSPEFRRFKVLPELEYAAAELGFPLVIKPSDRTGSRGVVRVDEPATLAAAYEEAAREAWTGPYLVEEYLTGGEISVECVTRSGVTSLIAVNDKRIGPPPYFVETETIVPAALPEPTRQAAFAVAKQALRALGVDDTVTHTELRLTPTGPQIVEVNGRPAGMIMADMVLDATGTNLYEVQWDVMNGREPTIHTDVRRFLSCRSINSGVGVLTRVDFDAGGLHPDQHSRIQVLAPVGSLLAEVRHSNDSRGYVIGRGDTPDAASAVSAQLLSRVTLTCEGRTAP